MGELQESQAQAKKTIIERAKAWGESSLPPVSLAAFIFAQHARPFQAMPMLFPPLLVFSTYLNLQGYTVDSAGTTAGISGLYLVLASRRRHAFMKRFGARGIIRGASMGFCLANVIGGGLVYTLGARDEQGEAE